MALRSDQGRLLDLSNGGVGKGDVGMMVMFMLKRG